MNYARFAVARQIMHFGLWLMPSGRSHLELHKILTAWGRHVKEASGATRGEQR